MSGHNHHDGRAVREVRAFRSECPHCKWMSELCPSTHVADAKLDDHIEYEHITALEPERWERCTSTCVEGGKWGAGRDPLGSGWHRQHRWLRTETGGHVVHEVVS